MLGSDSRCSNCCAGFIWSSAVVAPGRLDGGRCAEDGDDPAVGKREDLVEGARDASTAPISRASVAGDDRASRTVSSAQSAFRPRVSAIERMLATASLRTFWPRSPSMSSPWPPTGVAAPMFVPGAITATWPASVMNVPALAARAPDGVTHTIVGSGASSSVDTMRWVASRLPPGVLSWMTTAVAPSRPAWATPSAR